MEQPNAGFIRFLDTMILLYCGTIFYLINDNFRYAINDIFNALDMLIWHLRGLI
jgi:hypothetical protein